MFFPDEEVEGEFNPLTPGQALEGTISRLELAAKISRFTESPIETMFGLAMLETLAKYRVLDTWELIPQLKWGRFRIDWALRRPGKPYIFIECDGHEFHSAAADVARDGDRDQEVASAGIKTIRFSGRDIFANAALCAYTVICEGLLS